MGMCADVWVMCGGVWGGEGKCGGGGGGVVGCRVGMGIVGGWGGVGGRGWKEGGCGVMGGWGARD